MPDLGMLGLDIDDLYETLNNEVSNEKGSEYQYRFADSNVRKHSDYRAYGRIMHGSNPNNESADKCYKL